MSKVYIKGATGALFASGITFLSYPLLSTLYSFESFGDFGKIVAISLILSSLSLLRFEYFVASSGLKEKVDYLVCGLCVCMAFTCLFFVTGFLLDFFGSLSYLYLVTLIVLSLSIYNICLFYYSSVSKINVVNRARLIRSVMTFGVQYLLYTDFEECGLVVGYIIGNITAALYFLYNLLTSRVFANRISFGVLRAVIHRRKDIVYQMPQAMISSVINNSMVIFVELLYGISAAGVYTLVDKVIRTPVGIVLDAVRPILINRIYDISTKKGRRYVNGMLGYAALVGAGGGVVSMFISFIPLGEYYSDWNIVSPYILPVFLASLSMVISTPVYCYLLAHNLSLPLLITDFVKFLAVASFVYMAWSSYVVLNATGFIVVVSALSIIPPIIYWSLFLKFGFGFGIGGGGEHKR